jgi:hypothetical protein
MLAPQTLLHTPMCLFSRKGGRSLPAGESKRRRGYTRRVVVYMLFWFIFICFEFLNLFLFHKNIKR